MINDKLFKPDNIAIIGASNNTMKPGGKIVKNLLEHNYKGKILPVNPNDEFIQNLRAYSRTMDLPQVDLAILAIPAIFCLQTVKELAENKNAKAIIIVSAGFGENSEEGKLLEREIVKVADCHNICLI